MLGIDAVTSLDARDRHFLYTGHCYHSEVFCIYFSISTDLVEFPFCCLVVLVVSFSIAVLDLSDINN